MAFRGRGRGGYGRGGGGSFGYAKQEPFLLFPEIENLPDAKSVTEEMALVLRSSRLQKFWNSSVYYLKDEGQKDGSASTSPIYLPAILICLCSHLSSFRFV
ncbi:uncharacterized protein LOC114322591 isoform X2 [Camellia sinensis]|uniref:uncharacterized protein LOC114322591 isoform X2 n=1 Tax=Camellia sinensis TaxID=4442 RepID=UPI0010367248|nr:uncharacterized protein LOC114322591 isoform X2 [Camellia sinensis]